MFDDDTLKQDLIAQGKLSVARLEEAQRLARQSGVSLTEALVSRLMISFSDLGEACARVTGLPYLPLMHTHPPTGDNARWLSAEFTRRAGVFPVAYEPRDNVLVLAVRDPDRTAALERVLRFFMQDTRLQFTIASDVEIARAHERLQGRGRSSATSLSGTYPRSRRWLMGATAKEAPAAQPKPAAETPARSGTPDPHPAGGREPSYAEMSQALVGAATLLVRQRFGAEPERLQAVRTRVRYCQLMASRLKLTSVQADGLVLAAWLSALDGENGLAGQLATPYRLDEILSTEQARPPRGQKLRVEALILGLVKGYSAMRADKPEICRDVNLTRRELFMRWAPARENQTMLETFLQILVDEEFLDQLGRSAGRILIVDPEELARCTLAPPLISMGYDVIAMPDTRSARAIISEFKPDLILVSVEPPADRVLWFCERLKGDARTAGTPILAVVGGGDPQLSVKCLRAGANDFLTKPVHPELLFLKVQNHLSAVGVDVKECGVSGTLDEMSFTDMIQILCAGRRSVDLFVTSDAEEGRVYIRDGEVVHAILGPHLGENAFYAMMRWKTGTFTTRQCGACPDRTIHVSAMSLLMEGARQADESAGGDERGLNAMG